MSESCGAVPCCAGLTCNAGTCGTTSCNGAGQNCGTGCCANLTCTNGTCQAGGCSAQGAACGTGCCQGLVCTANTCQPACSGVGAACGAGCCGGLTCMAGTCQNTSGKKAFGQAPCTQNTDCTTNICAGFLSLSNQEFCTADCTNSATCAQLGGNYWCVQGGLCLRGCTSGADCTDLGSDWSCDVSTNIEQNMWVGLCGVWKNLADSESCTDSSQCASGNCNVAWCQALAGCGTDADCGTGKCAQILNGNFFCFPSCPTGDCSQFDRQGFTPSCKPANDKDGTQTNVCSA